MSREAEVGGATVELLLEAGAVLASSLELPTTMSQVAHLTVPRMADLCVIDALADDGSITDVAVAAQDPQIARELEALRARYPIAAGGEHPVARVLREGEALLFEDLDADLLRSFAQGSEHERFMFECGYRSAIVAPLSARRRTLGTLSLLRLAESAPYREDDLAPAVELARRAALAIDNARLFSQLLRLEQRLAAMLENLAEAITMEDATGVTVFANRGAAQLLGVELSQDLPAAEIFARFLLLDEHGRELGPQEMPARRLFAGERPEPLLVRSIARDSGEERWLVVRCSPLLDPDSRQLDYAVNVFEDITAVKRAEIAETFMAEASRVLTSSMDYATTLQRVAQLAVPQIADWCAVDVLGEGGEIERVAAHHADPAKLELLERLGREHPPALEDEGGVGEVLRSGQARLYTAADSQQPAGPAQRPEHRRLLRQIGAGAVIVVPMLGATQGAIGTITLATGDSPRRLTGADLGLAVRLGRRAGTAVERARIYTERARIAHILQRALLPQSLPEIPGAEVRALYAAAGELNEVGGDFYDVLDQGEGRWLLIVGDVVGKGARAAGVTALARHTLRAAALSGQPVEQMLRTLHLALQRQPAGADLCTVCVCTIEKAGAAPARASVTLAGHPAPVLIGRGGEAREVGAPGTLLGVVDPISVTSSELQLQAGETLLLYTDGVTEAGRAGGQRGERRLLELCAGTAGEPLRALLERIEAEASERAGGSLLDDIALLAVRIPPGSGHGS